MVVAYGHVAIDDRRRPSPLARPVDNAATSRSRGESHPLGEALVGLDVEQLVARGAMLDLDTMTAATANGARLLAVNPALAILRMIQSAPAGTQLVLRFDGSGGLTRRARRCSPLLATQLQGHGIRASRLGPWPACA
ncbi:hypothetical protein BA895_02280 [Humibacillus sp. DSM 29435]|uniref:hypothetical protein n=1 Tax=Humibacillus sp. DSM 29435 TaxID=1869167 RepID=UPI00087323B0|nr:hypothetical protein [Humibacillus sp. DSM 29435]OFE19000.1 hypothetical protein BA895_02280 [Humibacillus sp. DSM 29435]